MTSSPAVPATLRETLEPAVLSALEAALSPPEALRPAGDVEMEIEAEGEGTFTLALVGRHLTGKKGFAKKPLVSAWIGKGAWALLQKLDAAVARFPAAPELARLVDVARAPKPGALDDVIRAMAKLPDVCVRFDVSGYGQYAVARGAVDEAAHTITVKLDGKQIDAVLAGAPLTSVKATVAGDRGQLPAILTALAPVLPKR